MNNDIFAPRRWPIPFVLFFVATAHARGESMSRVQSGQITPLPVSIGLAGVFAGTSQGALIVAGGANFPNRPPWEGGRKVWHDDVYMLSQPNGTWRSAGRLPTPLGYGVSLTTDAGLTCIGGSDFARHFADCFTLSWKDGRVFRNSLPPLPKPLANACGAALGKTIYIAGGTDSPDSTKALNSFYALDLAQPNAKWQLLPSWPGPGRMFACAAAYDGSFYLMSGVSLVANAEGKPERVYLRDAYRYTPEKSWQRIADLPRAAAAAPSPAPIWGSTIVIIGGDDGTKVGFQPPAAHPGFASSAIGYNSAKDRWLHLGRAPVSRACLPAIPWQGRVVLTGGEIRPGVRSPEVWSLVFPGTEE